MRFGGLVVRRISALFPALLLALLVNFLWATNAFSQAEPQALSLSQTQPVSQTQPSSIIRVGVVELGSGAVLQLGDQQGFFAANNIQLKYLKLGTAQQVAIAVASGNVDVGVAGLTAGLYNLAGKDKLKLIAGSIQQKASMPVVQYVVSNAAWNEGVRNLIRLERPEDWYSRNRLRTSLRDQHGLP